MSNLTLSRREFCLSESGPRQTTQSPHCADSATASLFCCPSKEQVRFIAGFSSHRHSAAAATLICSPNLIRLSRFIYYSKYPLGASQTTPIASFLPIALPLIVSIPATSDPVQAAEFVPTDCNRRKNQESPYPHFPQPHVTRLTSRLCLACTSTDPPHHHQYDFE